MPVTIYAPPVREGRRLLIRVQGEDKILPVQFLGAGGVEQATTVEPRGLYVTIDDGEDKVTAFMTLGEAVVLAQHLIEDIANADAEAAHPVRPTSLDREGEE